MGFSKKYRREYIRKYSIKVALVCGVTAFLAVACTSSDKKNPSDTAKDANNASWAGRMQLMASGLEDIMPYVFSRQEFADPANKAKLRKMMAEFGKSVALVPQHVGEDMLGKDPIVKFTIQRLEANTKHALRAYDEGHIEFSRSVLRENMGLCFTCHTTNQLGPQTQFTTAQLKSNFRIYPTERADYYVSTRQYDKAIQVLEGVIQNPGSWMEDPHEQVSALRKYLSLMVRVKEDPARAARAVEGFLANQKLPYFISVDAEVWLKSLREWQREKGQRPALAQAQALMRKAKASQSTGGYQSALVDYLRASALLHSGLRSATNAQEKAQIYEWLGQSYETLAEIGSWDLPEVYFEACIRSAPKTKVAQKCYKDFERTIVMGFSGSAGIFIPKEERERMAELKTISGLN